MKVNTKSKRRRKFKRRLLQITIILTALLLVGGVVYGGVAIVSAFSEKTPAEVAPPVEKPVETPAETPAEPAYTLEERDGVTYVTIQGYEMILVNKQFPVPDDYGDGLTAETEEAYDAMKSAAAAAGYNLYIISGFRSYETQRGIHNGFLNSGSYSREYVKQMSAEPGHSEHQTGLAMDIGGPSGYDLAQAFGGTDTGIWLAEHAHEYGFILRYMKDKTWATGYIYEPWHFRYVGVELAKIFYDSGLTVEEYLGLPDSPAKIPVRMGEEVE